MAAEGPALLAPLWYLKKAMGSDEERERKESRKTTQSRRVGSDDEMFNDKVHYARVNSVFLLLCLKKLSDDKAQYARVNSTQG